MNHREKLKEIYKESSDISDIKNISNEIWSYLNNIIKHIGTQKGVFTVLVTLLTHKILEKKQDIRYFQNKMKGGFSARSIDTKYITPTLKELGLSSMAESGWLTRSLEQPYPYTMDYKGAISGKDMKESFLKIIDCFQKNPNLAKNILRVLLNGAIDFKKANQIKIKKISTDDTVLISTIIKILDEHFSENYHTHGGSKLPVLAFYSIYENLIKEVGRYKKYTLAELGSHTASDRTSKTAGDIQIMKGGKVFEAIEVKLDRAVDVTMARIAYEKIAKFNPERYYILSYKKSSSNQLEEINKIIFKIKEEHGCQLIVNGLLHTINYYLRLLSNPKKFLNKYIELVEKDSELKSIHKKKLKEIIKKNAL